MKTITYYLILSVFFLLTIPSFAQETAFFLNIEEELQIARELYRQEKYNAAYRQYEKVQKQVDPKSELYSEALYFKAVSALKAGHNTGNKFLEKFIDDYPDSPYINIAQFDLAGYHFDKKHYAAVLRTYNEIDKSSLNKDELIKLKYESGYSHLMQEEVEQAKTLFEDIKDENNLYSRPATYYWAHIMYLEDNFQSALEGFTKLENDPSYSRVIPLYVSHIYYKQERYNDVVNYTTSILEDVEPEHKSELSKIIGDSFFHLREYEKAVPYLEAYYETSGPKTREDNYLLGYSYYNTGQFEKAVPLLENASRGKDEMAQNAYYHLADSYIKTGDKEKARVAFEAASEFDFNDRIKEDALFSYAKLTYELSYSPFNETINAFDRYISLYPNSPRNSEAYKYLTEVFMVTRNYADAISSIEKIENKTPDILRAYQRVTFFNGLEQFNNLAYNQAIDNFDLSLKNGSYSAELNARALYWKAEAQYRLGDYRNSAATYSRFLKTAGAFSLSEYKEAEYNLAYAWFKLEDYNQAATHFRNFINAHKNQPNERLADAYNRLGDYYFLNTQYVLARQNYQQAFDMKIFDEDYSLYQIAFCQGLEHNQQGKINSLQRLQEGFPESEYVDDALYELGRAYERLGQNNEAIQNYKRIISEYSESTYYPRALLQMGLIEYNRGEFNQALTYYKQVAEKYAGTPEAQAALLGIRNSYVEMSDVDAYVAYTRRLGGGANVTVSEQDSLTYVAAERLYLSGEEQAAGQLNRYLQQFPNGSFAVNANFYLAELLYKEGEYSEANTHYTIVARQPSNVFSEQALSRASELTFNAGDYKNALDLFNRLEKVAGSKWNQLKAYTGQMRSSFELKQYQEAIAAAQKVKNSEVANEVWKREAAYVIGKSNYVTGNLDAALQPLSEVAADTKLEKGAEAKYLISEIYYKKNQNKQAEDEVNDFISKGTPFQFWLGKAFLLLADVYLERGDDFQAKHTLRSVVENYGADNDGVKAEARRKLEAIEAKEQVDQQNARDSSFQMEIKKN
jgi:TolA-binding protein